MEAGPVGLHTLNPHRNRIMKKNYLLAMACSPFLLAALVACGTEGGKDQFVAAKGAALHQAADCGDLLAQIQEDAVTKLKMQVALYKKGDGYGYGRSVNIGLAGGNFADEESDGAPMPGSASGDDTAGNAKSVGEVADPSSHSETNTQVKDVDEADVVKVAKDGKRIYVLHARELKTVKAWPAEETSEMGSASVPGEAFELFVHEGVATVFSRVSPQGIPEKGQDYGGDVSEPALPGGDACYDYYYEGGSFTQVSVFDVSGDSPVLKREMIFEGDYVSSRRHEDNVRAVVRGGFRAYDLYYPDVEYYDSFGREKSKERLADELDRWAEGVEADIRSTTLEDWVPRRFEREGEKWEELDAQCGSYFVPEPGLVEGGITQVIAFDAGADAAPEVTAVLGGAETVYANHKNLVVAQADWRWDWSGEGEGPRTSLHQFELDGLASKYQASGFVPGTLINQFALDQTGDVLRLTTTENRFDGEPKNTVITVQAKEGTLEQLDRSEALGEPGETVFATRFIGDRGYVVTFRNTDPLYALDLSDPADIKVLGELHIPGFSDYIHPLGTEQLLTIGKDADEDGNQNGVALQLFDVSDPTEPSLQHKETYGGFSSSQANHNHKAFTYVEDYFSEGEDLLLFPLVTYEPEYRSGLEVVKVNRKDGFTKLGTIDHTALMNDCDSFSQYGEPCYYYYGEEMRRGMQIDDYIYALSQGGMTVHSIDDLSADAVATVKMDRASNEGCYYDETGWGRDEEFDVEPVDPPTQMGGASGL